MKYPMKLGQVFSYFPIYIGEKGEPFKFKWFYWRVGYSLVTFILFLVEFFFVLLDTFRSSLNLINISEYETKFNICRVAELINLSAKNRFLRKIRKSIY